MELDKEQLKSTPNLDGVYIRLLYSQRQGYPCPNPDLCLGRPIRIGDVGELTSAGFSPVTTATGCSNIADCTLPSLQSALPSLGMSLPELYRKSNHLMEGESLTCGINSKTNHLPGSTRRCVVLRARNTAVDDGSTARRVIQDIRYEGYAAEGALLAITSPARLETMVQDRIARLRGWLASHGKDLFQYFSPDGANPLYIVTGQVSSASWATATYSECSSTLPKRSLVLTRFADDWPQYTWTETTGEVNHMTGFNNEGAPDQCLFLRGFLLTPSRNHRAQKERVVVASNETNPTYQRDSRPGEVRSNPAQGTSGTMGKATGSTSNNFTSTWSTSIASDLTSSQDEDGQQSHSDWQLTIESVPSVSTIVCFFFFFHERQSCKLSI